MYRMGVADSIHCSLKIHTSTERLSSDVVCVLCQIVSHATRLQKSWLETLVLSVNYRSSRQTT